MNSSSLPNVLKAAEVTVSVLLLLICLFGLVTNVLSLIIFLQDQMRSLSINVFLAALSLSETIVLGLSLAVFVPGPFIDYYSIKWMDRAFNFAAVYLYPVVMTFHCCSIWLLVAVTLDRWFAVCKPLSVAIYCGRNRSIVFTLGVVLYSMFYNMVRFWEFSLKDGRVTLELRLNFKYLLWLTNVIDGCLLYLFPILILIYFNTLIAHRIRRAGSRRKRSSLRRRHQFQTARMLFYVVLCFIFCYLPSFILNIIEAFNQAFFFTPIGLFVSDLSNLLVLLNSATTTFFYLHFSSRYRYFFKKVINRVTCHAKPFVLQDSEEQLQLFSMVAASVSVTPSRRSSRRPIDQSESWQDTYNSQSCQYSKNNLLILPSDRKISAPVKSKKSDSSSGGSYGSLVVHKTSSDGVKFAATLRKRSSSFIEGLPRRRVSVRQQLLRRAASVKFRPKKVSLVRRKSKSVEMETQL